MLGRKIKMGNSQPSNEPLKQDLYTIQTTSYDKISYLSNQNFSQNAITTNRPNISPTYGGINYSNQASGESSTSNSNFQNKKISTQDTTSTLESKIFGLLQKIDGKIDRLEKRVNNIEEETLSKFSLFEQNKTSLEESGIPKYLQEIDEKVTRLGRKFEGWELGSSQPSFVKDINNKLEIMEGRTDSWGKEVEKRKKMKLYLIFKFFNFSKLILYEDLEIKDQQTLIKWLENQDDKTKKKMKFSVSHNLDLISTKSKILFPIKIGKNFISTEFFNKVSDYIMKYQRSI